MNLGIRNDLRLVKGEVDFFIQTKYHLLFKHTMADVWESTVARHPNKECIVFANNTLPQGAKNSFSFAEVNTLANRTANFLIGQGFQTGDTIALVMSNRPDFVWTVLGANKAGLVLSFLNYNLRPQQLAHCIEICSAAGIIYEDTFDKEVREAIGLVNSSFIAAGKNVIVEMRYSTNLSGPSPIASVVIPHNVIPMNQWINTSSADPIPGTRRRGRDMLSPWGFVYTSGTTGHPKAAVITNLRSFMAGYLMSGVTGIKSTDRVYTVLPMYHSAGGMIGMGIMVTRGCTQIISPKFSIRRFWNDVHDYRATIIQYIGELCRYLTSGPPHPLERKHCVRLAIGNGMRPDVWPKFQERFNISQVAEFYASTEGSSSMVNLCTTPADQGAIGRFGIIVRSLGLYKIVKYDEASESLVRNKKGFCIECGPGEVGELLGVLSLKDTTGLRNFAGYHGNKEATEKKIARDVFKKGDAWFRTGDLMKRSPEGRYYFVDRIGDTFRWRGENVATTEVAEVLSAFPGVDEINVYGVSVPGYEGRAGMAAITLKQASEKEGGENLSFENQESEPVGKLDPSFDLDAFAKFAKENLPSYAVPVFVRILPKVPITSTFKHVKKDLRDDGADVSLVKDDVFWCAAGGSKYEKLTLDKWHSIIAGTARL